jgi:hypothetical protein
MGCLFVAPAGATPLISASQRTETGCFYFQPAAVRDHRTMRSYTLRDFYRHGLILWLDLIDVRVDQGREALHEEFVDGTTSVICFVEN